MARFLLFFLLLPLGLKAQIEHPARWSWHLEPKAPKVGQTAEIVFTATIEPGWHMYSNEIECVVGPLPLVLDFEKKPASYTLIGKPIPIGAHKYYDSIFECKVADWHRAATVKQKIKVTALPLAINGTIESQVCTEEGRCIPLSDDFNLYVGGAASPKTGMAAPFPKPSDPTTKPALDPFSGSKTAQVQTSTKSEDSTDEVIDLHPEAPAPVVLTATTDSAATTSQTAQEKVDASTASAPTTSDSIGLWALFLKAFGFGFVAILTPCVYPMMPMTVSFFTRKSKSRFEGLAKAIFFGLCIIACYVGVGVGISKAFGPNAANEIATSWVANALFFIVFLVFGFSFLGYFEITLPGSWSNAADTRAEKGGLAGIFFMAVTLVIVSFSCTGPIASFILVQSFNGAVLRPAIGMLGFSLAFALPFTFFAAFPQLLMSLPRSGGWLNMVKVVFGLVELALAFKFLSIADLAYHWHLLDREVFLSIWIVIFAMLGFYLLGKLKFPHDDIEPKPVHWLPLTMSIAVFSFVVYLIPGLWGAPLKALAGYLPPLETQDFRPVAGGAAPAAVQANNCPSPRYADFLHLPNGLTGYFDLKQAQECAKATGKPIFIDFTGHGCVNCREMEQRVWTDPGIASRLREKFVLCALYADDKTELPEAEQYTSKVDGKLKSTIGKANLDLEVERFNFNAQPLYVILSPDGKVLTPPRAYDLDVAGFAAFLDKGLAANQ